MEGRVCVQYRVENNFPIDSFREENRWQKEAWNIISYYFSGSCQGTKQTGNASGSLSCLDEDHEGGPADDEGTGDFLSQRCQGTLQFH